MTFVENVNREMSSDNLTTVAVKETNEVVGFPDGMAVDEMEHAIKGDLNGVIRPWKRSFYEKNIREPLAKLGMSSFQPRFITEIKPTAERAFVTAFARGATADIVKPDFSDKEAAAYPAQAFAGQLAGAVVGLKGVGALVQSVKLPTFGAYAAKVLGKLPATVQKAIVATGSNAAVGGAYRAISETANEIRDSDHPEIAKIGKAALHDALWFGAAGGVASPLSKVPGASTTGGIFYLMAKSDGATETDALLNAGIGAGFHIVSGSHGEKIEVRREVLSKIESNISDYIQAKNPLVDHHVSAQAGREQVYLKAEQVLADLAGKDNIVRGKDGKPIEFNVDAQGKDAVAEVLKSQEATAKMVEGFANEIVNPEPSTQEVQRSAKETKIAIDQYRTAWKVAFENKNISGMARANKGLERNKQVPMFESNSQTDPYARKIAANPEQIKKVEDHVAKMKDELEVLKKEDAQDTEISPDRESKMRTLVDQISLSNDVLRIAKVEKIPDFKTTDEAVKFGEEFAGNPHIAKMLEKESIDVNAKIDQAVAGQEGMNLGKRAGLITEAIRASKGELTRAKAKAAIERLKVGESNARMEVIINDPAVVKAREASAKIPETYTINTPERNAMREKIAIEGYGKGAKVKKRRVDIVLGGPASGKSQVVKPLVKEHGSMVIDSDIYKEKIPEYAGGLGAAAVHKESSNIVEGAILDKALKAGDNIVYPRLGKNPKEIKRLIDLFNANGYEVHLHNVELPIDKAMERAISRFQEQGRFVDPLFIKQVGLQPRETYGMLKTDKGVKSHGSYSADVEKGKPPQIIEESSKAGNGKRGVQRADGDQDAGKKRGVKETNLQAEILKASEKAGTTPAKTKDWIAATLTNDEVSTNKELVKYFMDEGGFSKKSAEFIVSKRKQVRELPLGVKKESADETLPPTKKIKSSESGQAILPGIDNIAAVTEESINLLSPKTFVPKDALDAIMTMKGGLDRYSFELGGKLETVIKDMDKWTKEQQIAFVDNIKLGQSQADPALQRLADMMRKAEDARWAVAKEYKDSLAYKENHYRVLWKVIPGSKAAGSNKKGFMGLFRRPLQGTKGFAKKSTLESMSEGIAMGGEPYTYNPMKMWVESMLDMEKFITAQKMFRSMKEMGYVKFVRTGGNIPENYIKIDDNISKVYFPAEIKYSEGGESYTVVHQVGEYYVEKNVGRILNNYIGKDWIRSGSIGKSLLAIKNVTTSIELSLSPFHAAYVSLSTVSASIGLGTQKIINRAIMQKNPQAFLDGFKDIVLSGVSPVDYAKTGGRAIRFITKEGFLNTPEGKDFIKEYPDAKQLLEDLFTGGGKLAMHEDYKINAIRSFQEGIKNKEPWAVAMSSIPAANEAMMKPLFETYIPRLKIGTFLKEYSMEIQQRQGELKSGSLTRPELARRVWDSVENRLGEMNFDNLFWNRTFKSALQLTFRSVTWKLGALKNIGASLPEQVIEFKKAYDQGRAPLLTGNMGWLFGVASLATLFSYVTMGLTGQGKPKDIKDIIAPRYDKEGNRIALNTHIKDWVHIWHNPIGFVANSLTGELGRAADVWNNKDFYGVEIYHEDDPALKKAIDIVMHMIPIPFSISNQVQLKGEEAPAILKASTVAGLTQPSPGYISNTPAEEKAHEINREKLPVGSRTKEEFEKGKLKKELRVHYEKTGDTSKIDAALDAGQITAKEEKQIYKDAELSTLARLTKNMSYNEIVKVIEKASPDELKELIPIFNKKIQNKINDATTADEVDALNQVRDTVNNKFGKYN